MRPLVGCCYICRHMEQSDHGVHTYRPPLVPQIAHEPQSKVTNTSNSHIGVSICVVAICENACVGNIMGKQIPKPHTILTATFIRLPRIEGVAIQAMKSDNALI